MESLIHCLIDHQCPQCGAPATLKETDRLFRCDFCKVASCLLAVDGFRYRLPHRAPAHREVFYVPYWRFKGMMFSCGETGIAHRFVDTSQKAIASPLFPPSLGLRSQVLQLAFVGPEDKERFLEPDFSSSRALERCTSQDDSKGIGRACIGETLSLIYAPFYADKQVMDAILNQPVSALSNVSFNLRHWRAARAGRTIQFVPTICPRCGWDLQGNREALALFCANCASVWRPTTKGLQRIAAAHVQTDETDALVYLPFWRIQADVAGLTLRSYADLVQLANLPKAIQPGWRRIPVYFWGPAFKVHPKHFLRLTHQTTLAQPRQHLVRGIPQEELYPVTLPASESAETIRLNLAGVIRPKKRVRACLKTLRIEPKRALLVFLPFSVRHHDLVYPTLNIAVNRNQLALAGNL